MWHNNNRCDVSRASPENRLASNNQIEHLFKCIWDLQVGDSVGIGKPAVSALIGNEEEEMCIPITNIMT